MPTSPIRVLMVDDSPMFLTILKRMLSTSPDIEVVGTAANGKQALELIDTLKPTVICTDLHMPVMDGVELTRAIMTRCPCPILMVSSTVTTLGFGSAYQALDAGALDVLPKPSVYSGLEYDRLSSQLAAKIRILAGVRVFRRMLIEPGTGDARADLTDAAALTAVAAHPQTAVAHGLIPPSSSHDHQTPSSEESGVVVLPTRVRIVVIGASTGGPPAVRDVLQQLPANYPAPILCVQHISEGFLNGLLEWLRSQCKVAFALARTGEIPRPGTVYFPVEGTHLELNSTGRFAASIQPPFEGHRPSATILMASAAACFGSGTVGILLSGMGKDGADGMLAISRKGGTTIAQDEQTCAVFGMPKQAIELGAARYVLSPTRIGRALAQIPTPFPSGRG